MAGAVGRRIFVAKVSFNCSEGWVREGDTVREGHPLLKGRESLFEVRRDEAKFEYEAPKPRVGRPPKSSGA